MGFWMGACVVRFEKLSSLQISQSFVGPQLFGCDDIWTTVADIVGLVYLFDLNYCAPVHGRYLFLFLFLLCIQPINNICTTEKKNYARIVFRIAVLLCGMKMFYRPHKNCCGLGVFSFVVFLSFLTLASSSSLVLSDVRSCLDDTKHCCVCVLVDCDSVWRFHNQRLLNADPETCIRDSFGGDLVRFCRFCCCGCCCCCGMGVCAVNSYEDFGHCSTNCVLQMKSLEHKWTGWWWAFVCSIPFMWFWYSRDSMYE